MCHKITNSNTLSHLFHPLNHWVRGTRETQNNTLKCNPVFTLRGGEQEAGYGKTASQLFAALFTFDGLERLCAGCQANRLHIAQV